MSAKPVIATERLELYKPVFADVEPLFDIVSHPETGRFLGRSSDWVDHYTRFHRNAGGWYLHGYGNFIVRPRGEDTIIGTIGVFHSNRGMGEDFDCMPEAGWIMAHDQVGKGLANEGMQAVLGWFDREIGLPRIVCLLSPDNLPSKRLAEKLGFTPMRMANMPTDGEPVQLYERLSG